MKDFNEIATEIKALAERHIHDDHIFVVDVIAKGALTQVSKLIVLLDGDLGVSSDQCADLSRAMSEELEALSYLSERYTFEVSSPGVEHPLSLPRQYPQHTGRRLKVVSTTGKEIFGTLIEADDEGITLLEEEEKKAGKALKWVAKEEITIPYGEIDKTIVMISFN